MGIDFDKINVATFDKAVEQSKDKEKDKQESRLLNRLRTELFQEKGYLDSQDWNSVEEAVSDVLGQDCMKVCFDTFSMKDILQKNADSPLYKTFKKILRKNNNLHNPCLLFRLDIHQRWYIAGPNINFDNLAYDNPSTVFTIVGADTTSIHCASLQRYAQAIQLDEKENPIDCDAS